MSENDDTIQVPPSLTLEPLGYLTNHSSTDEPDQPQPLETYANELITNIIKDASEVASKNPYENFDNTNELNFPQPSKQNQSENTITNLDKSEYSTTNGVHDENDFDNEDIQNKMNDVIHDLQARPGNDTNMSRKSITSNHLYDDQANNSIPNMINPLSNNSTEGPLQSISESAFDDHHTTNGQPPSLPIRQDESSSDVDDMYGIRPGPTNTTVPIDDSIDQHRSEQENHIDSPLNNHDDFFNTKTRTIDDDQRPTSAIKQNVLDETTRFGTTSPPRVQSAASKRSVHVTPDEPSTSGDEKRTAMSPWKLPNDTGNDTDRDNREVANIARRPSRAMSPLNRPRSPTPNDSRKLSGNNQPPSTYLAEQSQSATHSIRDDETNQSPDDNQHKKIFEPSAAIIAPGSRRESTNKSDEQKIDRPGSAIKTKFDENFIEPSIRRPSTSRTSQFISTDEQSTLITLGEQLQIPTDALDNERSNSPPALPTNIQALPLLNPLLGSSLVPNEQEHFRPPSETDRKSPTTSMISNEKFIDGDILPSKSRRESNINQQQTDNSDQKPRSRHESQVIEQTPQISSSRRASTSQQQDELDSHPNRQVSSRRTSDVSQEPTNDRGSFVPQQQTSHRRGSITLEQKSSSRKDSTASNQQVSSERASVVSEQQVSHRRGSVNDEQKIVNPRGSVTFEEQISRRRGSITDEEKIASRKASTVSEQPTPTKRRSTVPEQQSSSHRDSVADEQKTVWRRESITDEPQISSKRESIAPEQRPSSRRGSIADEQKTSSRHGSNALEQKPPSRKGSTTSEQQVANKRSSVAPEPQSSSRRESTDNEQKIVNRRGSTTFVQQVSNRRDSTYDEQTTAGRKDSTTFGYQASSKRESIVPDQEISTRRESHVSDEQASHRRQSSFDRQEQKPPSKPISRKTSVAEQQPSASRRESQQQPSSSRRTSTSRDNQPLSARRSSNVHISSSQESSRRNSINKQEQHPIPVLGNKDSRRSSFNNNDTNHQQIKPESHSSYKRVPSSDTDDLSARISAKHKQESTSSNHKRQKSSSTADENDHRRPSFQRRTGQESKRNSNLITDETVVTPIIMDSSKVRQHNGKRASTTDASNDETPSSKLPVVNPSFRQEKPRRSETLNQKQIPTSNRSEIKHLSSSHATTPTEDEQPHHWTKQITVPSIHLTDTETPSPREDQPRPKSPNVEQIAERNPPPLITTSTGKKQSAAEKDGQKRKEQNHLPRRSTSAESGNNIQLVDDKSLDSASENNTDVDRQKRRHIKPKKKDVQTSTDQTFHGQQQQRTFFDEKELTSQKPLKATKPMSDHLHSTRRRAPNKELVLTTPETIPDSDTPIVRRTVKQTKDSNQDKDPVHVNVTVVVKKFAGTTKDGTPHTTAEAFIEQKPQQYFEPVQHPPEILPSVTTETKEKSEESTERVKSTDQQRLKSSEEKIPIHPDRHTQSDTEQIITETQKQRRRPKRISRTCQTYEHIFRRMEREEQQELRTTSDTEKNIQTRKSQLRPRKKSPRKNLPVYLSTDSFRLEELLPKQYHQSRRNMSKSSSVARSLSPSSGGKLLILRPTLPFHHTDAVNVQRVCLQYAIDLVPNESFSSGTMPSQRNRLTVLKQPEQTNNLPMISSSSAGIHPPPNKSNTKEKSASNKSEDQTQQRRNGGAV